MNYLVVMVVDNPDLCPAILEVWDALGVTGVTIINSTGLGRLRKAALLEDIPLMPSLQDFLEAPEVQHRTLLSVVKDEATVDKMVEEAQKITGDLNLPDSGILFVVPVVKAYGLDRIF